VIHFLEDGTPAVPGPVGIRPVHYCPSCRRFHPSNFLAVDRVGPLYVLKQSRSFDIWENDIYDRWVSTLSGAQADELARTMAVLDDSVTDALDLDWTKGTKRKVKASFGRLNGLVADEADLKKLSSLYTDSMTALVANAPDNYSARNGFLAVFDTDDRDERAAGFFAEMMRVNSKDAIGKYMDEEASARALKLIDEAVQKGKSPDEITEQMLAFVKDDIPMNKRAYADLVADQAMARARSWSEGRSMQEAGFESYQWKAVMQESTCDICRFLDGKMFSLDSGLSTLTSAVAGGVKNLEKTNPWLRQKGPDIMVGKTVVGTVRSSASGELDRHGEIEDAGKDLQALGIAFPPAHAFCKCEAVPVFATRWGAEPPSKEYKPPSIREEVMDLLRGET
jgi:SPP1 gp7 family putative phage head morphogenesis protein